jgi:hypothetical protein
MNRGLSRSLVRLYPRAWRERYGAEFAALLEDSPGGLGTALNVVTSALGERILPTTRGGEVRGTSRWENWAKRAPWALFGVAPVVLLVMAYSVALLILWTGWRMFLPAEKTPFVPVDGWAMAYFAIGRVLYFYAPILVGIGLAIGAVRSRAGMLWPLIGATAMALIGSMIQVQPVRPTLSEAGRLHLEFASWHPVNSTLGLALTILVYGLLRIRKERMQAP